VVGFHRARMLAPDAWTRIHTCHETYSCPALTSVSHAAHNPAVLSACTTI
jgi:hypothetical protein